MAQAGIHAFVGAATRKIAPRKEWFMLGIVLGNLFPDLDNYAVAIATLTGSDPHGLHRTFTHSVFTVLLVGFLFFIVARLQGQPKWFNLGIGLGLGIAMHIVLDLVIWFNGVELLWPFGGWVNFWEGISPPVWFGKLLNPAEFLFFALFLGWLGKTARSQQTDSEALPTLRRWTIAMWIFFLIFTPLAFVMSKGFLTIFGAFYLLALTATFVLTVRMRRTLAQA